MLCKRFVSLNRQKRGSLGCKAIRRRRTESRTSELGAALARPQPGVLSHLRSADWFMAFASEKPLVCQKAVDFADAGCTATEKFPPRLRVPRRLTQSGRPLDCRKHRRETAASQMPDGTRETLAPRPRPLARRQAQPGLPTQRTEGMPG